MTCDTRLWHDVDGLVCVRDEGHLGAHQYVATWAPDGHDLSEPSGHREG